MSKKLNNWNIKLKKLIRGRIIKDYDTFEKNEDIYYKNTLNKKDIQDKEDISKEINNYFTINDLNKTRAVKEEIADYYYNKDFLSNKRNNKSFLFITYTLNPTYNNTEEDIIEEDIINRLNKQKDIISNEMKYLNKQLHKKKIKLEYIQVKELTTNINIHIHTMYKINKLDINIFLHQINTMQQRGIFTRIEIVKEENKYYDTNTIKIKDKEILTYKKENEEDINTKFLSGKYTYIKTFKTDKEQNNILGYILKYIKKNTDNQNIEYIIFKELEIKKITKNNIKNNHYITDMDTLEDIKLRKETFNNILYLFHNIINNNKIKDRYKHIIKDLKINNKNLLERVIYGLRYNKIIYINNILNYYIASNNRFDKGINTPLKETNNKKIQKIDLNNEKESNKRIILKTFIELDNNYYDYKERLIIYSNMNIKLYNLSYNVELEINDIIKWEQDMKDRQNRKIERYLDNNQIATEQETQQIKDFF
jgi:hypothetical protein